MNKLKQFLIVLVMSIFSVTMVNTYAVKKITIYSEEYPPYNYSLEDDKVKKGYAMDLLAAVLKEINAPQTVDDVTILPWARGYKLSQAKGQQNMLFVMTKTPERLALYQWVGPIDTFKIVILAKKSANVGMLTKEELNNYSYTTIKNDIAHILLETNGVKAKNIELRNNFKLMLSAMDRGRADLMAYAIPPAWSQMRQNGGVPADYKVVYVMKTGDLYYAFNLAVDQETLDIYQAGLDKVKQDTLFMEGLYKTYLEQ